MDLFGTWSFMAFWQVPPRSSFISCSIERLHTCTRSAFLRDFWDVTRSAPFPIGIKPFTKQLYDCFFTMPCPRFFIPDVLPIPLPYYSAASPRYCARRLGKSALKSYCWPSVPVVGAFIATAIENRLLLPIPFWVILMSSTFAWVLKLRRWPGLQIVSGAMAALILLDGLAPSVRYIYGKTKSPFGIRYYAQEEVAVSRFLKHVVAGQEHPVRLTWNTTSSTGLKDS